MDVPSPFWHLQQRKARCSKTVDAQAGSDSASGQERSCDAPEARGQPKEDLVQGAGGREHQNPSSPAPWELSPRPGKREPSMTKPYGLEGGVEMGGGGRLFPPGTMP